MEPLNPVSTDHPYRGPEGANGLATASGALVIHCAPETDRFRSGPLSVLWSRRFTAEELGIEQPVTQPRSGLRLTEKIFKIHCLARHGMEPAQFPIRQHAQIPG
ncbi:hypothetical protein GCM10027562_24560 [Arthrobacter pigmenti]